METVSILLKSGTSEAQREALFALIQSKPECQSVRSLSSSVQSETAKRIGHATCKNFQDANQLCQFLSEHELVEAAELEAKRRPAQS